VHSKNVIAQATRPNGEQGWICKVCGATFQYSQPIGFGLQLTLLKAFMDAHIHDAPVPPLTPPAPGARSLPDMLAHAQQCALDAVFLDIGRDQHLQMAKDIAELVSLVNAIRNEARGSMPQCVNLDTIQRLIRQHVPGSPAS
jgi:hypothetical protein